MPAFRMSVGFVVNPLIIGLRYISSMPALSAPSANSFTFKSLTAVIVPPNGAGQGVVMITLPLVVGRWSSVVWASAQRILDASAPTTNDPAPISGEQDLRALEIEAEADLFQPRLPHRMAQLRPIVRIEHEEAAAA